MQLTPHGALLLTHARRVIEQVELMTAAVKAATPMRELRIGCTLSIANTILAPSASGSRKTIRISRAQDFILRELGSGTRTIFEDYLRMAKVSIHTVGESASTAAIIDMVRHGLGLGVISYRCVERYTDNLIHACPIKDMPMDRLFYICYSAKMPVRSQMQDFIEACEQIVHQED